MADVVRIAGGGLSGLATAALLARQGRAVEVFDRRVGGGGRFANGWQIIENATGDLDAIEELRAFGFEPECDLIPATRAVLIDAAGRRFDVHSDAPYAYFIRRGAGPGTLDTWLRGAAAEAGVVLREGASAPEGVHVVATGPRQADGIARELVFATDLPDTIVVLFDPRVTPTGYAYLFSLAGHGTFGVAQVRRTERLRISQDEAWARFREILGPFSVDAAHEGGQFMNFSLPRHLRGPDGRWYVGEAAGIQDFMFGLGNRMALRSAAAVAAGLDGRWDRAAFRSTIVAPMKATIALRWLYERMSARAFTTFCGAAARGDFRRFLIRVQHPRATTRLAAAAVAVAWRSRAGCRHGPLCSWCRRLES